MIIAVPKELKPNEYRIALTPSNVKTLTDAGHTVLVESNAGLGIGLTDQQYISCNATIIKDRDHLWQTAEIIIKVKEPIPQEYYLLRSGLILYTFLHLAADLQLTNELLKKKVISIGYETIELKDRSLPLLRPMSEVTGRLTPQIGAHLLEKHKDGGKGILLGGVTGVNQGHVVIIGAGVVGFNAAKIAMGLGAKVTVLDKDLMRLDYINNIFGSRCQTLVAHFGSISEVVVDADLVISSVLVSGAKAPMIITKEMVMSMNPGAVIIDVAIDQGGSVETIKPTTHEHPVYEYKEILHYGVSNIPGCVARTSTYALTNVSFFYALEIANLGLEKALDRYAPLKKGLNTFSGKLTHHQVSLAHNLAYSAY